MERATVKRDETKTHKKPEMFADFVSEVNQGRLEVGLPALSYHAIWSRALPFTIRNETGRRIVPLERRAEVRKRLGAA
jgi:hypothetical protein